MVIWLGLVTQRAVLAGTCHGRFRLLVAFLRRGVLSRAACAAWPVPSGVSRLPVPTFCFGQRGAGIEHAALGSCCIIFMRSRMPLPAICFIMSAMPSNCLTSSLTSCGSTPAPAAMRRRRLWSIDLRGIAALGGRHRVDDADQAASCPLRRRRRPSSRCMPPMPGIRPITFLSGPSLLDLAELLAEVVERELALAEPLLLLPHLVLVELLLGLFDQREHVAHAQDAAGHAVGMELLAARRDARRCR